MLKFGLAIALRLKKLKNVLKTSSLIARFYDLTSVGRIRMNRKLGFQFQKISLVLTREDIVETIRYLVNLRERGEGELDDIDHLG